MRQVLFFIPFTDIPVYGYGMMLFLAFVCCTWLGGRLARREGINPARIQDLAIWLFVGGILGGRLVYVLNDWPAFTSGDLLSNLWRIISLWDGGLVFYGAMFGGAIAFYLFFQLVLKKEGVSAWKMVDIIAPGLALGACLGRVGCLLTGCCFGNVACGPTCPAIHFPAPNGPTIKFAAEGYQTYLGFTLAGQRSGRMAVEFVEPSSNAARAGVRLGDQILQINHKDIVWEREIGPPGSSKAVETFSPTGALHHHLTHLWPRGQREVELRVKHANGQEEELAPFQAPGFGVHPTQVYESISMALLLFFLLSYYPYKTHDGSLLVFMMAGYAVHRFLNEMLRTDTDPVAFGMTLSQNISIAVLAGAAVLAFFVWRRPAIHADVAPPAEALQPSV